MEQNEDLTVYGEEYGAQEPCMVAPISFVDSESTIGGIDIDFNVTPNIDVVGDDGYDSNDPYDQEVDSDSDPDVDDVPDDIDDEDVNDDGNINESSVRNQMRRIVIYNNPRPHISLIDPDAAHVAEFLEYPEILPAHRLAVNFDPKELFTFDPCVRPFPYCKPFLQVDETWLYGKYIQILLLTVAQDGNKNVLSIEFAIVDKKNMESWEFFLTNLQRYVISNDNICIISNRGKGLIVAIRRSGVLWRSVYCIRHIAVNFHRDYKNADWKRQVVKIVVGYYGAVVMGSKLATLMPRMGQQQVNQIEAEHVFVEDVRDAKVANRRMARRFQTLHYPCAHDVPACAKVNFNVEQFVDDVYTLEHTLRVWENEFPVLSDLSTWKVPQMTFELVPDRGLRRNPRGRLQSSKIRNEMDIREKSDGREKFCAVVDTTQRCQTRNGIGPLTSSGNTHYPTNLDDKKYQPNVNAITQTQALAMLGLRLGIWPWLGLYIGHWIVCPR
ncbi:hypothetical protein PVK06_012286 [Gossypium arboreum]|uniref:MULE transposase domain-containing protein n=1 Tax=Gossypium arboreum TaxID=29729 RepID=A0ABR0QBU7_GOSAR|nr:hypothetical protein PVK06_012286 [Gossypium arboreum]